MRLDHLLSKEHLRSGLALFGGWVPGAEPGLSPFVGQRVLKGGTSIIGTYLVCHGKYRLGVSRLRVGGVWQWNVVAVSGGCLTRCWVLKDRARHVCSCCRGLWAVVVGVGVCRLVSSGRGLC